MEHSVLGPRWAYDGCADPVAMRALVAAILTGGHEAELEVDAGAGLERREPTARVAGSGTPPAAVPELAAVAAADGPDGRSSPPAPSCSPSGADWTGPSRRLWARRPCTVFEGNDATGQVGSGLFVFHGPVVFTDGQLISVSGSFENLCNPFAG
jgi:hypothetical protein